MAAKWSEPDTLADGGDGVTKAWAGLIKVVGATAGLAVVVYFVGAVTMWLRLKTAGLPADLAIEHYSRGQLVALGVRGILVVAGIIAGFAAVAYLVILVSTYLPSRRRAPGRHRVALRHRNFVDVGADYVGGLKLSHFRLLAALAAAVIVGTAFASWRVFAIVFAFVVAIGVTLRHLHMRGGQRAPSLATVVTVVLTAGAAGAGWQIDVPVRTQTVVLSPPPNGSLTGVDVPYFGQTDAYVYVADVINPKKTATGQWTWTYTGNMIQLPRANRRLTFPGKQGDLQPKLQSPAMTLLEWMF